MKSSLMCGLAKLKRKKIPNLFLGICIVIMAALLVNALVLSGELNAVFDRAYEEMEGVHLCCLWSDEVVSPDAVRQYLSRPRQEFTYQITENTKTIDYIEKDGVRLSNGILLELPETINKDMLSPRILDDSGFAMPQKDEIWITTKIANIFGLKVGDEVLLQFADQSVKVKVVKIVADTVFGSSNTNVYRMWCGYNRLAEFPMAENNAVSYLEIRFQEYSPLAEKNFIHDTEEYFKMPLGNALYTYEQIKSGYTAMYQMVGAILCFVSAVLAVTIIALTLFLINSDMDEDVRNIGIYKALGMTGMQIIGVYLISYGVTGFAGAAVGSVMGGWLSKGILTGILKNVGIYTGSFTAIGGYQLFVWAVITASVVLMCFGAAFKVRRLNASYAVRKGAWQTKEKDRKERKGTYYNGGVSFELYYAVRGMGDKKLRYGYIAGVSLIFGCLTIVCAGCLNAVSNIDKEPETWGFIKTDIYVSSSGDTPVSAVIEELEKDSRVDYTYGVNKVYVTYKPENADDYQSIAAELYELPWNEKIKDKSLYGRRPLKENEIGIGVGLAEEYGLAVGDKIELFVNGEKGEYEITGIFQTLSNYGKILRMVTGSLDAFVETDGGYGDYMLVLKNSSEKWEYAKELTEKYGGAYTFIASKSNGENITGVLRPAVGMILTVLVVISILITMNLTFLLVRREQNLIGLLKAVGMTSWQILKIYLCRNCLSAFAGSSLGLAIGLFLAPGLLTPYAKLTGLTEFPFAGSPTAILLALILSPACMLLGTCAIVKTINTISAKRLVSG